MKNLPLILIFTLLFLNANAQHDSQDDLAKAKVVKCKVTAMEYEDGKLIKKEICTSKYNKHGLETSFISTDSTGKKKDEEVTSTFSKNETEWRTVRTDIQKPGNSSTYIDVWLKDTIKHTLTHIGLTPHGDTTYKQTWYRDIKGKDSVLMNTYGGKTSVGFITAYDKNGNVIENPGRKTVVVRNDSVVCTEFYDRKDSTKLQYKECKSKTETDKWFYEDSQDGYVHGIKFKTEQGGKMIIKYWNNLTIERICTDKDGKLLDWEIYEYTTEN